MEAQLQRPSNFAASHAALQQMPAMQVQRCRCKKTEEHRTFDCDELFASGLDGTTEKSSARGAVKPRSMNLDET